MPARRFLLLFNTRLQLLLPRLRLRPPSHPILPPISFGCVIAMVKTLIKGELGQALGGVSPFGAAVNLHWLWIWPPLKRLLIIIIVVIILILILILIRIPASKHLRPHMA